MVEAGGCASRASSPRGLAEISGTGADAMKKISNLRWLILALLFLATLISYIDRQTLSVVAPDLRDELGISNTGYSNILSSFLLAYTIMQPATGWLIDRIGIRHGFGLIMLWWSVAGCLHALGNGVASFSILRFLLGAGQAGSWSASVKAVSTWFPKSQRGMANSIWGAGTSAGLVVTVPLVAGLTVWMGWRWAFLATGMLGFVWTIAWYTYFRLPREHPSITTEELELLERDAEDEASIETLPAIPFLTLLRWRNVWAVILARALADPTAWFYHYWTPEFLRRTANFSMADIGHYVWIPFLTQTIGILLGGTLSDMLFRRGVQLTRARMIVMLTGMILMTSGIAAAFPLPIVVVFSGISLATFGFGLWAPNMMSICGEAFPRNVIGSVTGLSGMGAGLGGILLTLATGRVVDQVGYAPVFVAVSAMPLLAFVVLYLMLDREVRA